MTTKPKIGFKLVNITTEEFALIEDNFPTEAQAKSGIKLSASIKIDPLSRLVGIFTKFQFLNEEEPFLILEVACHFLLLQETWDSFTEDENNTIRLPQNLLTHFLVLTVGTARGVIHAKKPKELEGVVLPTLNVSNFFNEDQLINLDDETEEE